MDITYNTFKTSCLFLLFVFLASAPVRSQNPNWFEDQSSLILDSAQASYVYVADLNMDNYPDLVMIKATGGIKGHIKVYMNLPDSTGDPEKRIFIDRTDWTNLDYRRNGENGRVIDLVAFADIDNDGDLDAVTAIYYHRWEYYHPDSLDPGDRCEVMLNNGNGRFSLLENSGLNKIGPHSGKDEGLVNITGITFLDYNKDGKLDLFLASWFDDYKNNAMTASYLLKGNGDGTFTDESMWSKIKSNIMPLYGANATDWNNDGWMDIATSPYCRSGGSLWKNDQNGRFDDVAALVGYNTQFMFGAGQDLCTWASQPHDYDNDGDIDFFYVLVHGGFNTDEGRSTLVLNKGASENYKLEWALNRVIRDPPRPSHIGDYDAQWLDFDNDMLSDLVVGSGGYTFNRRMFFLKQDTSGYLNDISYELDKVAADKMIREIYSITPLDYDLDGDDDLFFAYGDDVYAPKNSVMLLKNNIGQDNNYIGIRLFPPQNCNQSGVGCRIKVYSGGVTQMKEIKAGYGHFGGQQPFITNFGLAKNNKVDSVVVMWQTNPATSTKVLNPGINKTIIIDKNGLWGTLSHEHPTPDRPQIRVYPNPATHRLNISIVSGGHESYSLELIDVSGRVLHAESDLQGNETSLDISNMESGYYIIRYFSKGQKPETIPFLIVK